MASDDGVILTNDDAAQCKRYAVEKKYWSDPYISLLTSRSSAKHAPEISRGYYARVTAMRKLLHKFLMVCNSMIDNSLIYPFFLYTEHYYIQLYYFIVDR